MKKLLKKGGFTLVEMLAALMILVLLVVGMDAGISAANLAYTRSVFESNSAALAGILNTAMGDILRYSEDVRVPTAQEAPQDPPAVVFTNYDYGVRNGYFSIPDSQPDAPATLQIRNLQNDRAAELINTGAYPDLQISDFQISYDPAGRYFSISYQISHVRHSSWTRDISCAVRLLNP